MLLFLYFSRKLPYRECSNCFEVSVFGIWWSSTTIITYYVTQFTQNTSSCFYDVTLYFLQVVGMVTRKDLAKYRLSKSIMEIKIQELHIHHEWWRHKRFNRIFVLNLKISRILQYFCSILNPFPRLQPCFYIVSICLWDLFMVFIYLWSLIRIMLIASFTTRTWINKWQVMSAETNVQDYFKISAHSSALVENSQYMYSRSVLQKKSIIILSHKRTYRTS